VIRSSSKRCRHCAPWAPACAGAGSGCLARLLEVDAMVDALEFDVAVRPTGYRSELPSSVVSSRSRSPAGGMAG